MYNPFASESQSQSRRKKPVNVKSLLKDLSLAFSFMHRGVDIISTLHQNDSNKDFNVWTNPKILELADKFCENTEIIDEIVHIA